MVYGAAGADLAEHMFLFGEPVSWDDEGDRLADDLCGGVTEHSLGRQIPRGDDPVQILADNGIVRKLDNRRQAARRSVQRAVHDGSPIVARSVEGWGWRGNCYRNRGRFQHALYRRVDARRAVFGDRSLVPRRPFSLRV